MNAKTERQIENLKKQTIGVEIEMNHITRERAAKLAADHFGTGRYEYTASRNGYSTWSAWDAQGREWKFQKDVSIAGCDAEKCELVTPILKYEDIETLHVVDEKFCYHDLPEQLDPYDYEAFNASDTAFYVTCTNVETGKPEYLRITDMKKQIDLMRASASLPYASRIVEAGGKKLLDGGCSDSIPVRAFQRLGYGRNVVVLTRPEGYVKKPERRGLARIFYRRYPAFVKALESRPETYNRTVREIGEMERAGEVFVIRPSEALKIGRMSHDREEIVEAYKLGRRDAKKALGALKLWLGEKSNG